MSGVSSTEVCSCSFLGWHLQFCKGHFFLNLKKKKKTALFLRTQVLHSMLLSDFCIERVISF